MKAGSLVRRPLQQSRRREMKPDLIGQDLTNDTMWLAKEKEKLRETYRYQ